MHVATFFQIHAWLETPTGAEKLQELIVFRRVSSVKAQILDMD